MTHGEAVRMEQRPRLLLVEDESALRVLLARVLERSGYDVTAVSAGEEALELFAAGPEQFAAAVIDMTLPGMTGEAVVEHLHAVRPELSIVVTSGLAAGPRPSLSGERITFLQKPFLPARLVEALQGLLAAGSPHQSSSSTAS